MRYSFPVSAKNDSRNMPEPVDGRWSDHKEGRRAHRLPAGLPATLLSTALGRVPATVVNLSQSGCRIRTRARCHCGDHFVLKVDAIGPRSVTVAWHRGEEVGLTFAEPLGWTIVAALAFDSAASRETTAGTFVRAGAAPGA